MKKPNGRRPRANQKLKFPNDYTGKVIFCRARSSLRWLDVPGVFVRVLPSELKDVTTPLYSDVLIEFRITAKDKHWQRVAGRATKTMVHIEFVDRLRPDLVDRMIRYFAAIKAEHGSHSFAMPFIVVTGVVPQQDRKYRLDCGLDWDGHDLEVPVLYLDEFDFSKLSPRDQGLRLVKMFRIMKLTAEDVKEIRKVVRELFGAKDNTEWSMCNTTLLALSQTRGLETALQLAMELEAKMPMTRTETKRLHQSLTALMNTPRNQPYVEETVVQPAFAKGRAEGREEGREEGLEEGRHKTHVANLLQVLRDNNIRLSEPQKKRLRKLPCEKLPPMKAATQATSATDFFRRAGLNGAGPKK